MKIKGNINKNLVFILIPLITLVIIFSWFKEGKIISNNSEENLNIVYSQATARYHQTSWYSLDTGYKTGFSVAKYPTFAMLGILEKIGISASLRQAILLSVFMMIGMFSMYLLINKGLNLNHSISLIGSIFYNLNIYSMTQIWKRFLYAHMFAWAYLPLFLFLWIKWIESKKIIWLFLFVLTSVFFSYTFSQPAFLITIWAPAGIFVLVKAWQSRFKLNEVLTFFLKALIGFLLWCLVNIWWLYSMLILGSTWTAQTGQTWESDLSSLHAVSKSFPIGEVLLLRQSWYLSSTNDLGSFYLNPIIILINLPPFLFVILAIFKFKEYPYRKFLIALAFVGLFISKGTSFPFGYTFFHFLFSNFPLTTALRNSYEKFGIVWLLPYTIFFAIGFYQFFLRFKSAFRNLYLILALFLFCGLLIYPIWNGDIFPQKHRLTIPNGYIEANNYLNANASSQTNDRLFHIPFLLEAEKMTLDWGYVGEDPFRFLFDLDTITTPKTPVYDKVAELLPKFLNDRQFPKILGMLGVGYVILHKDSIYPSIDLKEATASINNWTSIKNKKEIGGLVIYSLDRKLINPRVYIATSSFSVENIEDGLERIISDNFDASHSVFIRKNESNILTASSEKVPQISFKKISNDHYLTTVKEVVNPFILVLNDTFDKSWQASVNKNITNKHFMVNGFANGWLIEKKGDYEVDIKLKVWPWD